MPATGKVGASAPSAITAGAPAAKSASNACCSRAPRSPPACATRRNSGASPAKYASSSAGVKTNAPRAPMNSRTRSTTSPRKAADSVAASAGVSGGHSRVFTAPARGALATIARIGPGSEPPTGALLRRQRFETARPPSGPDRLAELDGQRLALHLARERFGVVLDRNELDLEIGRRREQRVP